MPVDKTPAVGSDGKLPQAVLSEVAGAPLPADRPDLRARSHSLATEGPTLREHVGTPSTQASNRRAPNCVRPSLPGLPQSRQVRCELQTSTALPSKGLGAAGASKNTPGPHTASQPLPAAHKTADRLS